MDGLILVLARGVLPPLALHLVRHRDQHLWRALVLLARDPMDPFDVAVLDLARGGRARKVKDLALAEFSGLRVKRPVRSPGELSYPQLRVLLARDGDGLRGVVDGERRVVDKVGGRRQFEDALRLGVRTSAKSARP